MTYDSIPPTGLENANKAPMTRSTSKHAKKPAALLAGNSKIMSLLAVSGGALALPQTGEAAIVYSGPLSVTVGFSPGSKASWNHLLVPGGSARLGLWRSSSSSFKSVKFGSGFSNVGVRAKWHSGSNFAAMAGAGKKWGAIGTHTASSNALVVKRTSSGASYPPSFSHLYAAFEFADAATGYNEWYGWAELSLNNSTPAGPDVTIEGYAYDNTGAQISTGDTTSSVPESGPTAVLAAIGAALVLGADGIRRWRARKSTPTAAA